MSGKTCVRCGTHYQDAEASFHANGRATRRRRSLCVGCVRFINGATARRNAEFVRAAKDVPCADCGVRYPPHVMDFDHVIGVKGFHVSQHSTRSISVLAAEMAKCEVVCANCHRERTHRRGQFGRKRGSKIQAPVGTGPVCTDKQEQSENDRTLR